MEDEIFKPSMDTTLITRFISSWGWHLISVMFLLKAISFFILKDVFWFFVMIGVMILCEIISFWRKGEIVDVTESL